MLPGGLPADAAELRERQSERRDALNARYETAVVESSAAQSVSDQLRSDEREMKAGSRASTRQAGMELARERNQASRDSFRSALSQAKAATPAVATGNSPQEPAAGSGLITAEPEKAASALGQRPSAGHGASEARAAASVPPAASVDAAGPASPGLTMGPPVAEPSTAVAPGVTGGMGKATLGVNTAALQVQGAGAPSPAAVAEPQPTSKAEAAPAIVATERSIRTATERAKPTAETPAESAGSGKNIDRILRVLRGQILRDKSTTVIRMDPPELGYLRLQLDLHKDVLRLRIHAETDAARQMLSDDLDALRKGLEAGGLRLEAVEIRPMAPVDGSTAQQPQTPTGQDASAESRRGRSRDSRSSSRVESMAADRTNAVEPSGAESVAIAKDSRVNVVV